MRRVLLGLSMFCAAATATSARANEQVPLLFDARSFALGGAGVAFEDGAAAPFHNPANMSAIKDMAFGLTFSPYFSKLTSPWADPISGSVVSLDTPTSFGPLGMLSYEKRLSDMFVLGIAAFLPVGQGATYNNTPPFGQNISGSLSQGEVQIPLAFEPFHGVSIGAAYRVSVAFEQASAYTVATIPGAAPLIIPLTVKGSGVNWAGFQAGLHLQPLDSLQIGFNWRSKVTNVIKETINVAATAYTPAQSLTQNSNFITPNMFALGAAWTGLDSSLMVTLEGRYWMYKDAYQNEANATSWQDAMALSAGIEWKVTDMVPLRIGYDLGRSATTDMGATWSLPAPGVSGGPTVGAGLYLGALHIDLGLAYGSYGKDIAASASAPTTVPGHYQSAAFAGSLSVAYVD